MAKFIDLPEIRAAQGLINRYGYTLETLPVDVARIIKDHQITLSVTPLPDDISGVLDTRGKAIMLINSQHGEKRQRFSMAHELGHYLLQSGFSGVRMEKQAYFRSNLSAQGTDEDEKQANRFAAELLIPTSLLREKLDQYPDLIDDENDNLINQLADEFKVSTAALTIKLGGVLRGRQFE